MAIRSESRSGWSEYRTGFSSFDMLNSSKGPTDQAHGLTADGGEGLIEAVDKRTATNSNHEATGFGSILVLISNTASKLI
jgi:hypothetical protein